MCACKHKSNQISMSSQTQAASQLQMQMPCARSLACTHTSPHPTAIAPYPHVHGGWPHAMLCRHPSQHKQQQQHVHMQCKNTHSFVHTMPHTHTHTHAGIHTLFCHSRQAPSSHSSLLTSATRSSLAAYHSSSASFTCCGCRSISIIACLADGLTPSPVPATSNAVLPS